MKSANSTALAEALKGIAKLDLGVVADRIGTWINGECMVMPFFGNTYRIDSKSVVDSNDHPVRGALALLFYQYILRCPQTVPPAGRRMSYREMQDAGPLAVNFANNTHKTICSAFARRPDALIEASALLAGQPVNEAHHYDLYIKYAALPEVPLYLQFNAADDDFPANCSLLFQESAEIYLDMRSLFTIGTYLTGRLITMIP